MSPSQKSKAVAEKKRVGMGAKASSIKKKRMSKPASPKRKNTTSPKRKSSSRARPANSALYAKVKAEAKRKFKVWPSAYGSGWLVKEYKRRGGTYK